MLLPLYPSSCVIRKAENTSLLTPPLQPSKQYKLIQLPEMAVFNMYRSLLREAPLGSQFRQLIYSSTEVSALVDVERQCPQRGRNNIQKFSHG